MAYMRDSTGKRLDSFPVADAFARAKAAELAPVSKPSAFAWSDHPLVGKLYVDQYGIFQTTLDPATRKHTGGATYWVDGVDGLDTNAGTSDAAALKTLSAAIAKADVGTIMLKGYGVANPYYRGRGFNNATQTKPLNIIGYGTHQPYITTHDVLTFTLTASQTKTYQTTRSNVTEVIDTIAGIPGKQLVKRTSIAEVEASPGSWWQSGTTLYVHAADSRNLSNTAADRIWALLNVPNFRTVGDHATYLENLVLYGGTDVLAASGSTAAGGQLTLVNVTTAFSQLGWNNVTTLGVDAVLVRCDTFLSGADGYNYHALNGKVPRTVEIDCRATDCGHTASDQCSTIHDGGKIIRVGCTYVRAAAATVADVNEGTQAWNLGCHAEGSGQNYANWQVGLSGDASVVESWFHGCTGRDGTWTIAAHGGGVAKVRGTRVARTSGLVSAY